MKRNTYRRSLEHSQYCTRSSNRRGADQKNHSHALFFPVEFRITLFLILFFLIMILFGNLYNIGAHTSVQDTCEKYFTCVEVISGDTITEIALAHQTDGYTKASDLVDEICYINHLNHADDIYVGQNLIVPYYK